MKSDKVLWTTLKSLWDNGADYSEQSVKFYDYWDGKIEKAKYFGSEDKTSLNVVKEIVETKVASALDAQFSIQVVPSISPLKDMAEIKEHSIVADILNEELHHILNNNQFNDKKEKILRYGEICGFSALQSTIEEDKNESAQIKLTYIDSKNLRWDKSAQHIEDSGYIGYKVSISPAVAKERYAKKKDGSYDKELCKIIDELTTSTTGIKSEVKSGKIISYETAETGGLAYANGDVDGIQAGKSVELIVMFLVDTSVYSPEANDNQEVTEFKEQSILKYPNGRMVVFSLAKDKNIVFDDRPAPEGFKGLGNIDIFNPMTLSDSIEGKSEVEDLIPIQNRINGTLSKESFLISQNIAAYLVPDGVIDFSDADVINNTFIQSAKARMDGSNQPILLRNGAIDDAMKLLEIVKQYKQQAYTVARLNETMINGARQIGTTSAEQVESLNESPMSSIRMIQKNFKNFLVEVGNKIIKLIQEYYTENRIIEIASGLKVDDVMYKYVEMGVNEQNEKVINFYQELGQIAKTIVMKSDWEYKVDVIAGTEIPRSRKELANLVDKLYTGGVLTTGQDLDILELYLKSIDMPNYRAFINLLRQKQEQAKQNKPILDIRAILENKDLSGNLKAIFDALNGFSKAKGQLLSSIGLNETTDTLEDAPIQEVTAKSEVSDIAVAVPEKISDNPQVANEGVENSIIKAGIDKGVGNV